MSDSAWKALVRVAAEPYRRAGRFALHFARGKLVADPVFRHLITAGLVPSHSRVLDIGCGQGLLASLLHSAAQRQAQGRWPAPWAAAPAGCRYTGIELMPRDVARATAALGTLDGSACFIRGDMRSAPFPASDVVVILDVLHYISVAEQDVVLERVHAALAPGGALLLRIGDADARRGFAASQWVDRVVSFVRGHRAVPQHGRPLARWIERLRALGFGDVSARPMSEGTPFANVLLVATLPAATAAAPAGAQKEATA